MATFETTCGTGVSENKPARLTPWARRFAFWLISKALLLGYDKDFSQAKIS